MFAKLDLVPVRRPWFPRCPSFPFGVLRPRAASSVPVRRDAFRRVPYRSVPSPKTTRVFSSPIRRNKRRLQCLFVFRRQKQPVYFPSREKETKGGFDACSCPLAKNNPCIFLPEKKKQKATEKKTPHSCGASAAMPVHTPRRVQAAIGARRFGESTLIKNKTEKASEKKTPHSCGAFSVYRNSTNFWFVFSQTNASMLASSW